MKIGVYCFDWSGVISDDRLMVYKTNMMLLEYFNKPIMSFEDWLPQTTMTATEFLANNGVSEDPGYLYDLYRKFLAETDEFPKIYPGAYRVLEKLTSSGRRVVVLSSHPYENLEKEIVSYGLSPFIERFWGSIRDKVVGLRGVCKQTGTSPRSLLYIGDTIYDIRAAKGAEVLSAGICGGYHSRERLRLEDPDLLLENLSDLV